jgi:hypothetical protein
MSNAGGGRMRGADSAARARGLGVLRQATLGTRLVVRSRDGSGAIDALGELVARTEHSVTIETRRGRAEVALDDVIAARVVPPPPVR